jgi:hypothetical protein
MIGWLVDSAPLVIRRNSLILRVKEFQPRRRWKAVSDIRNSPI